MRNIKIKVNINNINPYRKYDSILINDLFRTIGKDKKL